MVSAGALWGTGDFLTQVVGNTHHEVDARRTLSLGVYGTFVAGPLYCWWCVAALVLICFECADCGFLGTHFWNARQSTWQLPAH